MKPANKKKTSIMTPFSHRYVQKPIAYITNYPIRNDSTFTSSKDSSCWMTLDQPFEGIIEANPTIQLCPACIGLKINGLSKPWSRHIISPGLLCGGPLNTSPSDVKMTLDVFAVSRSAPFPPDYLFPYARYSSIVLGAGQHGNQSFGMMTSGRESWV